MSTLPSAKADFSIGEVASHTQVPAITLRAWERRYNLLTPERDGEGHRRYTRNDMVLIERIKKWAHRGLPLSRIDATWLAEADSAGNDAVHDALSQMRVHQLYRLLRHQLDTADQRYAVIGSWSSLASQVRLMLHHRRNHYSLLYSALTHCIAYPQSNPSKIVLVLTTSDNYELGRLCAQLFSLNSDRLVFGMFCSSDEAAEVMSKADADGYLLDAELLSKAPELRVPAVSFCCNDRASISAVLPSITTAYEELTSELTP